MLPTPSEQYKIVNEFLDEYKSRGVVVGDKWYLLDNKWYENWKNYAKCNTKVCPFEIDNGSLLERWDDDEEITDNSSIIKLHLIENLDYILVPEEVWLCLEDWYHGGPCIEVKCEKMKNKVKINLYNENDNIFKKSNNNNNNDINKRCRVCNSKSRFVCSECLNTYYCCKSCQISDYGVHKQYCDRNNNNNNNNLYRGLVGISNIGNTCFMASSLQCLSNIYSLTLYFLRRQYMNHINTKNPLGTGGIIANSYAFLLKDLWLENYPYTSPSRMKKAISRFNNQFSGWSQNDSHEFLLFLLDMLHEDLNLIENKPYYESDDDIEKEKDEEIKSNLYWERFLSRNNSIITYYFTGQFVSNIECLECHYKVNNYSSFNSISLPFPSTSMFSLICLIIRNNLSSSFPANSEKYYQVTLKLSYHSQIIDIKKDVASIYSLPIECQEIIAINNNNAIVDICGNDKFIFDYYDYTEPINFLIYEKEKLSTEVKSDTIIIQQMHADDGIHYVNIPFILNIKSNKITLKELYHIIYELVVYEQIKEVDDDVNNNNKYSIDEKEWYKNISIHYYNKELNDWEKDRIPIDESITLETYCKNNGIKDKIIRELCINYSNTPSYLFDAIELLSSMKISLCESDMIGTNIYDCLDSFSCCEILDEENKWSCPKCKVKRRIQQNCFIQKFPKILILHLKRFSFINRNYVNKINNFVDFPLKNLDLRKYGNRNSDVNEKHSYDLISVVNHYGEPSYGHYVAYCKHGTNGKWFEYDDSRVNEIDEENVVTEGAYILFYKCNE